MTSVLVEMRERSRERASKWQGIALNELPDPFMLRERTTLGSYSYALQVSRIRLLLKRSLIDMGQGVKETPSTTARDYLILTYKRSPKVTHNQAVMIGGHDEPDDDLQKKQLKPYPLYAEPGKFDHGFYIDIRSAFWKIMLIAGWNVDYYPGQWLGAGRPPDDFPFPTHKQARSCLVSVARPGNIQFYVPHGQFPTQRVGSAIVNLSISKLISDVLNSIADTAVSMGVIYANTDGFIAPTERIAASVAQMILDWGLEPTIKAEGRGRVKSVGAYKVGETVSEPYKMRGGDDPHQGLHAPNYQKWLMARFSKIAASCKFPG